jgi:hypothetical protein
MLGQWIGRLTEGTNKGFCAVNFEFRSPSSGTMMFFDDNPALLSMWAKIDILFEKETFRAQLSNFLIFNNDNNLVKSDKFSIDGIIFPKSGEVIGIIQKNQLIGEFKTDARTEGKFVLEKTDIKEPDKPLHIFDWDKFKNFISEQGDNDKDFIYRGENTNRYRLKTTFHRLGRTDLLRYRNEDLNRPAYFINAISPYKYKINFPGEDLDALLSLAQHHGYPTPLLDWTESPYVAAYFAFQRLSTENKDEYVRIYVFDSRAWLSFWGRIFPTTNTLIAPKPIISIHKLPAMNNNRAIPQQSVSLFSNIVDIENFIEGSRAFIKGDYFMRIDLPYSEKKRVMRELRRMGITAASLFPGFDGICQSLKDQDFTV